MILFIEKRGSEHDFFLGLFNSQIYTKYLLILFNDQIFFAAESIFFSNTVILVYYIEISRILFAYL